MPKSCFSFLFLMLRLKFLITVPSLLLVPSNFVFFFHHYNPGSFFLPINVNYFHVVSQRSTRPEPDQLVLRGRLLHSDQWSPEQSFPLAEPFHSEQREFRHCHPAVENSETIVYTAGKYVYFQRLEYVQKEIQNYTEAKSKYTEAY